MDFRRRGGRCQELKKMLQKENHTWEGFRVAGGAGANAMTALKSRAVSGVPPTAAQVKGPQIQEWAQLGILTDLDEPRRRRLGRAGAQSRGRYHEV